MKHLWLLSLLFCGGVWAQDKTSEYTEEEKASIEKQYQQAIKSWTSQREDAEYLLKYGKVFTDHNAMVAAFNSYVNGGGQDYIDMINAVRAKNKRKYDFQPFYETVYPSCLKASTSMVWMNFWDYANEQNDFNKRRYLESYNEYVKSYNGCQEEVDAPKPTRADFEPNKCDIPGKCAIL